MAWGRGFPAASSVLMLADIAARDGPFWSGVVITYSCPLARARRLSPLRQIRLTL